MATFNSLISEILYEKTEQTLKIFYNIDVTLFPPDEEEPVANNTPEPEVPAQPVPQQPAQTNPAAAPAAPPQEAPYRRREAVRRSGGLQQCCLTRC